MKKACVILLGLLILVAPVPVQAQAFNYGALRCETNADGISITIIDYLNSGLATPVSIPATINTLPVTMIGDDAFGYCSLTSVTIPFGVTNIGDFAFESCNRLTNATIPGSVTNIGFGAFCFTGLKSVTISNGVTSIESTAFEFCTSLRNVTISASVTNIGFGAFEGCNILQAITVDAANLFYSSLNGVLFDESQTALIQAPGGLGGSYTIPGSVTSIGGAAFAGCSRLTNATIPGTVTSIGANAFGGTGLTNVTIPGSVTNIGDSAFISSTNLTSIYFTGNAPAYGSSVFGSDNRATAYYLPGTTGWSSTFAGLPAVLWNPLIQTGDGSFGVSNNQFGFNITGTANIPVVVEACTNLACPVWTPLQSFTLTNGLVYFSEPVQGNGGGRFYRIGSQ